MIMKVLVMVMKVLVMVNLRDTFEECVVCYKSYLSWQTMPNSQFGGPSLVKISCKIFLKKNCWYLT